MSANTNQIISCFENLIALDGTCGEENPSSGIFLKKLGVTRSELSQYLTKEYVTPDQLFLDKYEVAILNITNAVHNHFAPKYKAASILDSKRVGIFENNLKMISGQAGILKGIDFRLDNRSSFIDLNIVSISLQLNFSGEINLLFYDLIQGVQVYSKKITVVPNEIITMQIDKKFVSDRKYLNLFIGYDSTAIASNKTSLQLVGGCATCTDQSVHKNNFLTIRSTSIGIAEQKIDSNLTSETDTGGLSIVYALNCNHRDWICAVSQILALAIAYETCAGLMEHAKYQSGKEQITIRSGSGDVNIEIEERRAMYEHKSVNMLKQALNNMILPNDERCFSCRPINRTAILIP